MDPILDAANILERRRSVSDPRPCDVFITARLLTWPHQEPREPWIVGGNQRDCSASKCSKRLPVPCAAFDALGEISSLTVEEGKQ